MSSVIQTQQTPFINRELLLEALNREGCQYQVQDETKIQNPAQTSSQRELIVIQPLTSGSYRQTTYFYLDQTGKFRLQHDSYQRNQANKFLNSVGNHYRIALKEKLEREERERLRIERELAERLRLEHEASERLRLEKKAEEKKRILAQEAKEERLRLEQEKQEFVRKQNELIEKKLQESGYEFKRKKKGKKIEYVAVRTHY